jgi:hypothetical protein
VVFIGVVRGLEVISTGLVVLVDGLECFSATAYKASSYYISFYIDLFKNSFLTGIIPITSLLSCLRTLYDLAASMAIS